MSNKSLLQEIKVGPYRIPVVHVAMSGLQGEFIPDPMSIKLDPGLESTLYWSAAFHESLHVLENLYGLKLSEKDVRVLENGIIALLMDNPAMLAGLVRSFLGSCRDDGLPDPDPAF